MTLPIDVNGHKLPKLSAQDIIEICEIAWRWLRRIELERLNGASEDQKREVLDKIDEGRGSLRPVFRYAETAEFAVQVVGRSIKRSGLPITFEDLDLDPTGQMQRIAAALFYVRLPDPDADPTNAGERIG